MTAALTGAILCMGITALLARYKRQIKRQMANGKSQK
jgi:hypothetical protein